MSENCSINMKALLKKFPHYHEMSPSEKECTNNNFIEKDYPCDRCGETLKYLFEYKLHILDHFQRKLPCTVCPKTFTTPYLLHCHMQRHSDVRPFVCGECSKGFFTSRELASHKRVHTDKDKYICFTCLKGFIRRNSYIKHLTKHKSDKPFQCQHCPKKFGLEELLDQHSKVHISRACPFCDEVFYCKRNFTKHIKKDHPEKNLKDLNSCTKTK